MYVFILAFILYVQPINSINPIQISTELFAQQQIDLKTLLTQLQQHFLTSQTNLNYQPKPNLIKSSIAPQGYETKDCFNELLILQQNTSQKQVQKVVFSCIQKLKYQNEIRQCYSAQYQFMNNIKQIIHLTTIQKDSATIILNEIDNFLINCEFQGSTLLNQCWDTNLRNLSAILSEKPLEFKNGIDLLYNCLQ